MNSPRAVGIVAIIFLALARAAAAADPVGPQDAVFKDKKLSRNGDRLVLSVEAQVHDAVKTLRVARAKAIVEGNSRKKLDAQIASLRQTISEMNAEYSRLNDMLASLSNPTQQNQVIGKINYIVSQTKEQQAGLDKLIDQEKSLTTAKEAYVDEIEEVSKYLDTDEHAYDDLAKDAELQAAVADYNKTARWKLKLGPSGDYLDYLAFVKKCVAAVSIDTVAVSTEHNVPEVQAVLNGKVKQAMVWDSGASLVTISSELAGKLGLHPTDKDPVVKAKVADGRVVTAHMMIIKSITVGAFTVKDVDCMVMPPELKDVYPLLGDTFQSHFLAKLNQDSGELRLIPIDSNSVSRHPGKSPVAAHAGDE